MRESEGSVLLRPICIDNFFEEMFGPVAHQSLSSVSCQHYIWKKLSREEEAGQPELLPNFDIKRELGMTTN